MFVLGVEDSLSHRSWVYHQQDEKSVEMLMRKYQLPEILARVLVSRQVDFNLIDAFLNPTLKKQLPEPCQLKDMQKAVNRLAESILNGEEIGIMGDYDVDGATSSALLKLFLNSIHVKAHVFIPDRDDGYGPNIREMQKFYHEGIRLVVTVDCGICGKPYHSRGCSRGSPSHITPYNICVTESERDIYPAGLRSADRICNQRHHLGTPGMGCAGQPQALLQLVSRQFHPLWRN